MNIALYLLSIIISYFLYRYNFKHMDEISKKTAPIPMVIIALFIPFANIIAGILMYFLFVPMPNKAEIINKIFFIK